jgi:CBS domain-containing protein
MRTGLHPAVGLRVRDVMHTGVITVEVDRTVRELTRTLAEHGIRGVPVVDSAGRVVGVVSTTDVIALVSREAEIPAGHPAWNVLGGDDDEDEGAFFRGGEPRIAFTDPVVDALAESGLDQYSIRDIMTPVAFSVEPDATLPEVVELFRKGRIHRLLVIEGEEILGIVTPFDLLEVLARILESDPEISSS